MEGELVGRILTCGWCEALVVVCQSCDHGKRYCSTGCSWKAREACLKRAGARYQQSFKGKEKHAARQAAYRNRKKEKVTHQSFPAGGAPVIVVQAEQGTNLPLTRQPETSTPLHCDTCRRKCDFVVRRWIWPYLRPRILRKQGEEYDSFKGDRSSDTALVPC